MKKLAVLLDRIPSSALRQAASDRIVLNDANVGIEMELEEFNYRVMDAEDLEIIAGYWEFEKDDSLRGRYPMEFKFREPMAGDNIITAIETLINAGNKYEIVPRLHARTSTHVHMDVRDLTYEQFYNLLAIYATFEKLLFKYVGNNRVNNPYCLPMSSIIGDINNIRMVSEHDFRNMLYTYFESKKYAALNISAAQMYGSLEFRHLGGCFDQERIIEWTNILLCLKRYVLENDDLELASIPSMISSTGELEFVRKVFGPVFGDAVHSLTYPGFEQDMREGIRIAQLFIYKDDIAEAATWLARELFNYESQDEVTSAAPQFWINRNDLYYKMMKDERSSPVFKLLSSITFEEDI